MTPKNSERLAQLHDHHNVIRLVTLPNALLEQAVERPTAATSPHRAMMLRHTGLEINPHLFRPIAVYLYRKERPGDFETIRRLLKHRNSQTTMEFYAERSSQWAHEH